jgi:hypothetical protein
MASRTAEELAVFAKEVYARVNQLHFDVTGHYDEDCDCDDDFCLKPPRLTLIQGGRATGSGSGIVPTVS